MEPPEARLAGPGWAMTVLGTVAGFGPDADRVRRAFDELRPTVVALGVPPDDLPALRRLAADPASVAAMAPPDAATVRRLDLLSRYGPTAVPSPDLQAACRLAAESGAPVAAIDLADLDHSYEFTRRVKVRHLIRSNRRERRLMTLPFGEVADAYELARAWDEQETKVRPYAELERLRERHMAARLAEMASGGGRLLAIVPAVRAPGVLAELRRKGY